MFGKRRGDMEVGDHAAMNRRLIASQPSWFIPPPHGWRHPVSGRLGWQPDPLLVTFGQYVKRSRYLADLSQRELGRLANVDQALISRLERALAPATKAERLVRLAAAMGRDFPLGYCPHEHRCQWQPAPPPPAEPDPLPTSGPEADDPSWLTDFLRHE
jgi:transcriptional regulator with XRE-family HTH domain